MKKNTRIIAVYADSFNGKLGATLPYISFAKLFGTPRLVTADDDEEEVLKNCDALLIPGGADVDSHRYGERPHPYNSRANMHYEYMDKYLAPKFIEAKKPVIGICRGFQSLNVMFGGNLYQHIIGHSQAESRTSTPQTLITTDNREFNVNSMHHQAVKQLGDGLIPLAYTSVYQGCPSTFDREGITVQNFPAAKGKTRKLLAIVEAFKHETLPIVAFQWHPEEFNCEYAIETINEMFENY